MEESKPFDGHIIIKFSGDAKIGIFRRSQNTVNFYPRSGIAVLIDRRILPSLEKEKVYSVKNPKFRILEKCVIFGGIFNIVSDSECEKRRHYEESIYITHPIRVVKLELIVKLTDSVKINSMGSVETSHSAGIVVVKEKTEYEESPLPSEYQWMLEKISAGKKIFEFGDIYLSQDENLEIVDARIVKPRFTRMAEYSIKTSLPIYDVSYRKHDVEWNGQRLFHLKVAHYVWGKDGIFYPENGIVKIVTSFQGDEPKEESSIPTDENRAIDDGEMPSGFAKAMMRMAREHHYSSSSRGGFSSSSTPKVNTNINCSGNVAIVEFCGRKYAVAFDRGRIDHLVTDDVAEMDKMVCSREERIKQETFELYQARLIAVVKNEVSPWNFSENYFSGKYSDSETFRKDFEIKFPSHFSNDEETGLYKQLKSFVAEIVEKFQNSSSEEDLEKIKLSYINSIKELEGKYNQGKSLISDFSNFFTETLKQTLVSFISDEVSEIYEEIKKLENMACDGDIEKLSQAICVSKQKVSLLPKLSISQKEIVKEKEVEDRKNLLQEAGLLGVPEHLLDAFSGNIQLAIQFMSNVSKIETWRLDANELSCGRSRARSTCEDAWSAMGESSDFFYGADPNDVKYYVYEHHFGEDATPIVRKEEKGSYNNNLSTSNDAMEEALRKAGLI